MLTLSAVLTSVYAAPPDRARLERLLLEVAAGDREALAELYRQTRGAVYGLALTCLHNAEDARDVTQDTFVRIWEMAEKYRPQGTPMAWILTVARNLALMCLRERGRETELDGEGWNALPAGESRLSPEDRALLQDALGALTPRERRVVILHAVSGLRHREIARVLEMPLGSVLSLYRRSLKKLRRILEESHEGT